ncbi:zinc finger CCCH type domain-containing protein ZFN-like 2 [Zea mays]|uniref:Zinc finger CCCH domain-containing protein 33 n=2 Tax=Zea mays TaxID=4577 RepID=B4FIU7_MAIZE|eukprot:NP_001150019.2 zinc finger CCCH type domain-containing protein ZFN-like 2 [Zea mays]
MDDAGRAPPPAPAAVTVSATAAPAPTPPSATAAADKSSLDPDALYEEGMWQQMAMNSGATMQPGSYPERPGEPDCTYYLRTGLCRFGMSCRFNHPPDRNLAIASARMKGEYPERVGQPECQYYLKTGTCKFGPTCKFHHPREKAGIAGRVQLNTLGYPLLPNEKECAYYLKTGQCKYANTCKFHHPELFNVVPSSRGSPIYTSVHSSASAGPQSYTGTMSSWTFPRASFIPSPRWQSPSNYAPMVVPHGLVQVPSWNSYPGQLQSPGAQQTYGSSQQGEASAGNQGMLSPYRSSSFPVPQYALQRDNVFPERPDEPECQYYMKTGDCKFGAVCKFHHPRVRSQPPPDCVLSPMGLPIRPGEELCKFYSRYGICKFGANCKFDHPTMAAPMGVYAYGFSGSASVAPASTNAPMTRHLLGSPSGSGYMS